MKIIISADQWRGGEKAAAAEYRKKKCRVWARNGGVDESWRRHQWQAINISVNGEAVVTSATISAMKIISIGIARRLAVEIMAASKISWA